MVMPLSTIGDWGREPYPGTTRPNDRGGWPGDGPRAVSRATPGGSLIAVTAGRRGFVYASGDGRWADGAGAPARGRGAARGDHGGSRCGRRAALLGALGG